MRVKNICGAKTRAGNPCGKPPLSGRSRCRLHGGCSTGPTTAEGKAKISAANFKHGRYVNYRARRELEKYFFAEIRRVRAEARGAGLYADQTL